MTQEEKAKAYDEAKLRMSAAYNSNRCTIGFMNEIFPELKESEDEKIRKMLIEQMKRWHECALENNVVQDIKDSADAIAWLEKKGEQKTTIEMKTPEESLGIDSDTYNKIVDECVYSEQKPTDDDIKDIVDKEANSIWKEINTGGSHSVIDSFNQFYGICMQVAEAVVDCKKPTEWSEEDNKMIDNIVEDLYAHTPCSAEFDRTTLKKINYLKSLKERVSLQPKQEWSEKDEVALGDALWCCKQAASIAKDENDMGNAWYAERWLKSLKDRYSWKPSEEHYELEEFAKIIRGNLTGISKAVQELFEAKYLQLTGNKMYGGFKD